MHSGGAFDITASDAMTDLLLAGGGAVSTSSAAVAASIIVIDRHGRVDTGVGSGADIEANGGTGLTVSATQSEDLTLIAIGGSGGDSAAVAGSVIVDVMTDHTLAHIGSNVTIGGTTLAKTAATITMARTNTQTIARGRGRPLRSK